MSHKLLRVAGGIPQVLNCMPKLPLRHAVDLYPMPVASRSFLFPLSFLIFICISGASDDDLSVFAVIMCTALAPEKQLCYKPDIKTKLDACVPQHLGHQCPINTNSQSIPLPSLWRSLMKPWVETRGSGQYSLTLAFTHRQVEADAAVEILGVSLYMCRKGHRMPALLHLSSLVKMHVHENVTLSEEGVCRPGVQWPPL